MGGVTTQQPVVVGEECTQQTTVRSGEGGRVSEEVRIRRRYNKEDMIRDEGTPHCRSLISIQ